MMVSPVQRSDKALGGVRGQVEDGNPGGRRKLDSRGDPGGMRRPRARRGPWREEAGHKGQRGNPGDRLPCPEGRWGSLEG